MRSSVSTLCKATFIVLNYKRILYLVVCFTCLVHFYLLAILNLLGALYLLDVYLVTWFLPSFLPRTIKQWNSLPAPLATAPNLNFFDVREPRTATGSRMFPFLVRFYSS